MSCTCTSICYGSHEFFDEDEDDLPITPHHIFSQRLTLVWASLTWNQLKIKKINDCYLYHQVSLNHIDRVSNPKHYVLILCRLIQMSYSNNKFVDAIRYYKALWRIMNSTHIELNICTLRTCCFLLFRSRAPQCMVVNLLQSQIPKGSIDVRQNDKNGIRKLRLMLFNNAVYLYMNQRIRLPSDCFSNFVKNAKNLLECWQRGRERASSAFVELYDIYGYMGYYHIICQREPMTAYKYFIPPMLKIFAQRNFECKDCCSALCIDKNVLLYTFCIHLSFGKADYKMANYLYKIALKHNPFDPALIRYYGIFLVHCGKYKKALKYLKKSVKVNADSCILEIFSEAYPSNKSYIEHAIDKMKSVGKSIPSKDREFWYDTCFNCGEIRKRMKRCKKCRIASYCNRKCQKVHWKKHRTHCSDKDYLTVYDRVYYYLLRDYQHFC